MKKRKVIYVMLITLSIALLFLSLFLFCLYKNKKSYASLIYEAAIKMERVEVYLKERCIEKGMELVDEDINSTYLVGPDFTELTSTPGDEREKRSTLNPYSAAAVTSMLLDAGLKKGDTIAIGASGSYPGFFLAALSAASELDLKVKLILSLGSSMYGATRLQYNIFDIARDARESGLIEYELLGVSRGYKDDKGGSVLEGILYNGTEELSLDICREEAERSGCVLINPPTLQESIEERLRLFGEVKLFINVGGAPVNIGDGTVSFSVPAGLVMEMDDVPKGEGRGVVYEYLDKGIPVINLLDSKGFSEKYNVEFDASPFPEIEKEPLGISYLTMGIISLVLSITIITLSSIYYVRRKRDEV